MIFNEALEQRQQYEEGLLRKWDKALSADGGIKDEHMAKTTAILLENYMQHLQSNPSLIAEERISTNNFKGVNLALLGLIRRAIPTLVGAELVGVQAMPTPQSPIFYMAYKRTNAKGDSLAGSELFGYPGNLPTPGVGNDLQTIGSGPVSDIDPFYSSSQVRYVALTNNAGVLTSATTAWGPAINGSVTFLALNASNEVVGKLNVAGSYDRNGTTNPTSADFTNSADNNYFSTTLADTDIVQTFVNNGKVASTISFVSKVGSSTASKYVVAYEYSQESNGDIPEIEMQILQYTVSLIRRQLRGRFSLDAAVDAKAYHGISLENELMEMMKLQLTNEINREIVSDLRKMAKISKNLQYGQNNTTGNYDDTHRLILDTINGLSAEIYNQTRVGRGNFVIGNPVTLSFLDRVPGFVGSGVDMTSGGLSYAGKQGGRISFYFDPQYPKSELLIGYKGASALDCGYIHAPYLPITATPTLYNQETGDPSKIFYTRYGKTFKDIDEKGEQFNAIYRGGYFYAKLTLDSAFPTLDATIAS